MTKTAHISPSKRSLAVAICRALLGLVFVFSGFVKGVDPWGTALKTAEYLSVWGVGSVSEGVRMALAIALCAAELALGLALVVGVRARIFSLATLVFMSAFLVVTLLGATVLPIGDCGCFGDAVPLGPWASVAKNIVLWGLAMVVWLDARRRLPMFPASAQGWVVTAIFTLAAVGLGVYSFRHLPLVDFLPFKQGVSLREINDESDIRLREFAVFDSEGDATRGIVESGGRVYMLCAVRLDGVGEDCGKRFADIALKARAEGAKVLILTSSPITQEQEVSFGGEVPIAVCNIDRGVLQTMLRARNGVVVLDDGVIVDKRNCRDIQWDF